jgi:hypothetical protein
MANATGVNNGITSLHGKRRALHDKDAALGVGSRGKGEQCQERLRREEHLDGRLCLLWQSERGREESLVKLQTAMLSEEMKQAWSRTTSFSCILYIGASAYGFELVTEMVTYLLLSPINRAD